jgi:NitT/TauT family transport system substrate-binding protein
MNKKIILGVIIVFQIIVLTACNRASSTDISQSTEQAITKIRLPMGYIPNVQYAPFYVASARGFYQEEGLEIEFDYSPETDGVALVGADELRFAVVSGEQVLLARAQGIPIVYVMAWWHDYPVGMVSLKDENITNPSDLKGKTIGIPGLYGASYIGFRALLNSADLEESDVTLESIGYNQVEALLAGQIQSGVIYVNNEPVQLESQDLSVDVIKVADYVHLASNGLITNEKTIQDDPELISRMVSATMKGIEATLADPDEAFEICKQYVEGLDSVNEQVQREVLERTIEFWDTEQLGISDQDAWENMQAVLLDMEMLSEPLDIESAYTNQFITP